jgi:hypothetical protein
VPVAVERVVADVAEDAEEEEDTLSQLRSYSGVVPKLEPTMPNEGLGVDGAAS